MKLIYWSAAAIALGAVPPQPYYFQSKIIEHDHVEVVYLPNNTCHITGPLGTQATNYKDYVRACLNNQHLRKKISTYLPN